MDRLFELLLESPTAQGTSNTSEHPSPTPTQPSPEPCLSLHYVGDRLGANTSPRLSLDYDHIRRLVDSNAALESSLRELESHVDPSSATKLKTSAALEKARASAEVFRDHANHLWKMIPTAKHVSANGTAKALQVFDTPELLEEILSYLNAPGKLTTMLVRRTFRDTILGSTRLQKSLGLIAYMNGHYYSPFSRRFHEIEPSHCDTKDFGWNLRGANNVPAGEYRDEDSTFRWDEDSHFSFWTINNEPVIEDPTKLDFEYTCTGNNARLGSRIRSMLICDPPLSVVEAFLDCSENAESVCHVHGAGIWSGVMLEVKSSSTVGFTIGELADTTTQLLAEHKQCGLSKVAYTASMQLQESDPVMIDRRGLEHKAGIKRAQRRERRRQADEDELAKQEEWQRLEELREAEEDDYDSDNERQLCEDESGAHDQQQISPTSPSRPLSEGFSISGSSPVTTPNRKRSLTPERRWSHSP